jgi:hypothetical protein
MKIERRGDRKGEREWSGAANKAWPGRCLEVSAARSSDFRAWRAVGRREHADGTLSVILIFIHPGVASLSLLGAGAASGRTRRLPVGCLQLPPAAPPPVSLPDTAAGRFERMMFYTNRHSLDSAQSPGFRPRLRPSPSPFPHPPPLVIRGSSAPPTASRPTCARRPPAATRPRRAPPGSPAPRAAGPPAARSPALRGRGHIPGTAGTWPAAPFLAAPLAGTPRRRRRPRRPSPRPPPRRCQRPRRGPQGAAATRTRRRRP